MFKPRLMTRQTQMHLASCFVSSTNATSSNQLTAKKISGLLFVVAKNEYVFVIVVVLSSYRARCHLFVRT